MLCPSMEVFHRITGSLKFKDFQDDQDLQGLHDHQDHQDLQDLQDVFIIIYELSTLSLQGGVS